MLINNQFNYTNYILIFILLLISVNSYSQPNANKVPGVFNFKCEDIDILNSKDEKIGTGKGYSIFISSKEGAASFIDNNGIKYSMTFFDKGTIGPDNFVWAYGDGEMLKSQNYVNLIRYNANNKISLWHIKRNGGVIKEKVVYFKCS